MHKGNTPPYKPSEEHFKRGSDALLHHEAEAEAPQSAEEEPTLDPALAFAPTIQTVFAALRDGTQQ